MTELLDRPQSLADALDQRRFLSQNAVTGEIMPLPLTLRQLCRILCPVSMESVIVPSPPLSDQQSERKPVSQNSQLLAIETDGTYSSEGWKLAKDCPVLKETVALWYYQQPASADGSSSVSGPVSCRVLANLLDEGKLSPLQEETRVYSDTTVTWETISKTPNLMTALEAFRKPAMAAEIPPDSMNGTGEAVFPDDLGGGSKTKEEETKKDEIQDELEAFLSSTDRFMTSDIKRRKELAEAEDYESDGGTRYVKDIRTGNWIHEGLLIPTSSDEGSKHPINPSSNNNKKTSQPKEQSDTTSLSRKRKRPKFSAKHAKCWIYISGLPTDCTVDELQEVFSKAGIIDLDPETQQPKIKIYRHQEEGPQKGQAKGDASICYARPESVELAITLLDESFLRPAGASIPMSGRGTAAPVGAADECKMKVERAKFEQHGNEFDVSKGKARVSNAKRQVAKLAAIQAIDWDDGEFNGRISGGRKGLRIIVIKNVFDPRAEVMDDEKLELLEQELSTECVKYGELEKITVFASNPDGVVIVKFFKPGAAVEAVKALNGHCWNGRQTLRASFWDGVSDYTVHNEEKEKQEMEQRQEEFGNWLEGQEELPDELRLKSVDE